MKRNRLFIVSLMMCMAFAVSAENSDENLLLDKLTSAYDNTHLFEAQFSQTKQVKFMQKPLISKGRIRFAKGHGLLWIIDEPFESKTLINEQGVFKTNQFEHNKPVNDPQMKAVASVLGQLLSSEVNQLAEKFKITVLTNKNTGQWSVALIPKTSLLKKVLKKIEILGHGSDDQNIPGIKGIMVTDNNINTTRIDLSDMKIQRTPLTAQQISEF